MRSTSKLSLMVCLLSMLAGSCLAQGCGDSLAVVNSFRAMHQAPALQWSNALMAAAQDSAGKLAANGCSLRILGRNQLVFGCSGGDCTCSMAANSFYQGASKYDFKAPQPWTANEKNFMAVGTFMQMVWKSATQMGCAAATGPNGCTAVACNFDAGVISMDQWVKANVFPKVNNPTTPNPPANPSTPKPPTVTPPPSTPSTPKPPAGKVPTGCQATALNRINLRRAAHNAVDLTWSNSLTGVSQATAKRMAGTSCAFVGSVAGQVVYSATGADRSSQCGKAADNWYQGASLYRYEQQPWTANQPQFNDVGSFMNMVWAGAKKVGCAEARGRNGCIAVVCTFDAAIISDDATVFDNVLPDLQPPVQDTPTRTVFVNTPSGVGAVARRMMMGGQNTRSASVLTAGRSTEGAPTPTAAA